MNNIKSSPVGIDIMIQRIQIALYEKLILSWGDDINGYGRVYKTKKQRRTIPEFYSGSGEYIEVLTNDMKTATFFFIENNDSDYHGGCVSKSRVDLYFLVDVVKAKPKISHYPDEEVRIEILDVVKSYFSSIEGAVKGRAALSEFTTDDLHFIHPYFIFKIKGFINNY